MKHRPYVVVAPSHGTGERATALHSLCHELNALGFEARLLVVDGDAVSVTPGLDPALRTPCLNATFDQDPPASISAAIVVCDEQFPGPPFEATRVVRYVLGKEVPANDDNAADFKVYASRAYPADRGGRHPVLYPLVADLADFNDHGADKRTQDLWWRGGNTGPDLQPPAGLAEVTATWPATPAQRAAVLRGTRHLYSFDASSSLNVEAILCGAVVVLAPFGRSAGAWTKQDLETTEHGSGGFAYGDNAFELDRARRTRQEMVENMRYQQAIYRRKLLELVAATQQHFR